MARKQDIRRRAIGGFFLLAAIAMLVVGETFLRERLRSHPAYFVLFWMICVVLLGLAVATKFYPVLFLGPLLLLCQTSSVLRRHFSTMARRFSSS